MPIHGLIYATRYWRKRELALSRSLAAVAAACLAAATAQSAMPGVWHSSHPRNWVIAVVCCLLGLRIVAHARRNAVGWLLLAVGTCAAIAVGCDAFPAVRGMAWVSTWAWWPTYALLPVVALVFPNGRLPSRRWWWRGGLGLALAGTALGLIGIGRAAWSRPHDFWQQAVEGSAQRGWPVAVAVTGLACSVIGLLAGVASLLLRWHRTEGDQRRLLVWAASGAVLTGVAVGFEMTGGAWTAWATGAAVLPISTLVAIMRYGLYDIELVIHRSLLYGLLVIVLVGVHAGVAMLTTAPLPDQADTLATVAVVVVLAPLYRFLQAALNRWLYGDRDNPYAVLSRLAQSMANPLPNAEVFPAVARSAADALKLPYVAVLLDAQPRPQLLASYGRSHEGPQQRFEMRHRGTRVGELVAEARSPDEGFSRRERRLLDDLAQQVAPTARSERLGQDLRRVRASLAETREKERRYLRWELHDGIRSGLAGIGLQIDTARQQLADEPAAIDELLGRVRHNVRTTLRAVEQVVTDRLEPADLDRGLAAALRQRATACVDGSGVVVTVTADNDLGQIPHAVEYAAYWVAAEAMTNAGKHSRARECLVRLSRTSSLEVEITDDGKGLPADPSRRSGLLIMRERCDEVDGELTIGRVEPHGTRVHARFPLEVADRS